MKELVKLELVSVPQSDGKEKYNNENKIKQNESYDRLRVKNIHAV